MKQYYAGEPLAQSGAQAIALDRLTPVQRLLMVCDGTVTELLEAYFLEPVAVRKLGLLRLQSLDDERIYEREVVLVGQRSSRVYVHARSTILLDRLPESLRRDLLATSKGIGQLLREGRIETFRELEGFWQEEAGLLAGYFGCSEGEVLLGRSYSVRCGASPVMRITERFVAAAFI